MSLSLVVKFKWMLLVETPTSFSRDYIARTIRGDYAEQPKYNPVQFILNIAMAIVALASLVFATTGVLQVLQGFCIFGDEYC